VVLIVVIVTVEQEPVDALLVEVFVLVEEKADCCTKRLSVRAGSAEAFAALGSEFVSTHSVCVGFVDEQLYLFRAATGAVTLLGHGESGAEDGL